MHESSPVPREPPRLSTIRMRTSAKISARLAPITTFLQVILSPPPLQSTMARASFRWLIRSSRPSRRCACRWSAFPKRMFSLPRFSTRPPSAFPGRPSRWIRFLWSASLQTCFSYRALVRAASSSAAERPPPAGTHHLGGAEQRRRRLEIVETCSPIQTICSISRGMHQISAGVWFQRLQDNENTASRRLGQASFASLTTFLQGTVKPFQVVPKPNGTWAGEACSAPGMSQDTIQLRRNFTLRPGLRHEFTTGWNEVIGPRRQLHHGPAGRPRDRLRSSAIPPTRRTTPTACSVRASAWRGIVFGNGKTAVRAGFGTYYSLIDDLGFLLNSLPPYNGSASFANASPARDSAPSLPGVAPPPSCGPGVPALHHLRAARHPVQRKNAHRAGMESRRSSSS